MKEDIYCKNCGNALSSTTLEICDNCKKNHDLSVFLKNLIDFLDNKEFFVENDFEEMGIDEFTAYEYIWELSRLNLVNLYDDKYFINLDLINEFVDKHYLSQYDRSLIKINGGDHEVYDPLKVKITNNPDFYRNDIISLVENIEFIEESPNIPFPQADDLNRLIFIGQHLLEKDLSKEEIKEINQVHDRIVNMYTRVGFYFGIFEEYKSKNSIYYKLTIKGKSIFELDEYNRNIGICHCILEHEIFYRIFNTCLEKNEIKSNSIVEIMGMYDLNLNSDVTLKRRAGCVSSWMHWIFKLMYSNKNFK
ncbi:hypothetical protein [Methanobrevibacter sp.]|uniref:DUF7226 domain-containing protein n=1 Tax=Methanobrevibacter sp. TaxID=66852 RepID=UPI0038698902